MTAKDVSVGTRREQEEKRLRELHNRCPKDDKDFPFTGVLLSDAIKKCCDSFGLITPLKETNLKPANYKLRIGDEYAIRGKIHPLTDLPGDEIAIDPFEVAIIKTLETINMPRFLIARWNIQVSRAYEGLLWVGGPQVDAGYVGYLFCPIYNLSDKSVILRYGDPIAVIDFEKTTHFHESASEPYRSLPERILFQDYEPESLQSGLATQVRDAIKSFGGRLDSLTSRIDFFVTITFALLAILFAAGTLFVTEKDHPHWWDPSVFWICVLSIALSGWALVRSRSASGGMSRALEIVLCLVLLGLISVGLTRQERLEDQINQLENQIQAVPASKNQQNPPPGTASKP
jgi:deoxycytidine triphosphate deaminase